MNMPVDAQDNILNNPALLTYAGDIVSPEVANQGIKAVLQAHNLDWEVKQYDVYTDLGKLSNMRANYRSDDHSLLGLVTDRYQVLNNYEALAFIDELEDFIFDRAGCSSNGKQVFVVGKTSNLVELDTNDTIEEYVTFIHGHDGAHAVKLIISPIRTSCTNQLNLLLNNNDFNYSIKHIGNLDEKLAEARQAMVAGSNYMQHIHQALIEFRDAKLEVGFNLDQFTQLLVSKSMGKPNGEKAKERQHYLAYKIVNLYNNKPDLQNYKQTKLGVLNAVADFVSHQAPQRKNSVDTETNMFLNTISTNKMLDTAYKMLLAA